VPVWVTVVAEMADRLAQVTGVPADPLDAYLTNRHLARGSVDGPGERHSGHWIDGALRPPDTATARWLAGGRMGFCLPQGAAPLWRVPGHRRPAAQGIGSARELAHYRLPDPTAPGRFDVARERAARYGRSHALLGIIECTVFEMAWKPGGLEQS